MAVAWRCACWWRERDTCWWLCVSYVGALQERITRGRRKERTRDGRKLALASFLSRFA